MVIEPLTSGDREPPGGVAIATADDDYISWLGDRIANLTLKEAVELSDYLETQGVKK